MKESDSALAPDAERNYRYYNTPSVVADYDRDQYLLPVEKFLFDSYVKPRGAILDIAVGAGRTAEYLARNASRYLGIDYAPEMLKACRRKYPQLEFQEMSATDLSSLQNETFDAVVISFNAIDELLSDEDRRRCLLECRRVLRAEGVLIFSSRTPHAILARRTPGMVKRYGLDLMSGRPGTLTFHISRIGKFIVTLLALTKLTLERTYLYARMPAFWKGEGYMLDTSRLRRHYATPHKVIAEMSRYGWQLLATQGGDYPGKIKPFTTYFHYYAFRRPS